MWKVYISVCTVIIVHAADYSNLNYYEDLLLSLFANYFLLLLFNLTETVGT